LVLSPLVVLATFMSGELDHRYDFFVVVLLLVMLAWWWLNSVLVMYHIRRSIISSVSQAIALGIVWLVLLVFAACIGVGVGVIAGLCESFSR
jgi:hypothetical protein